MPFTGRTPSCGGDPDRRATFQWPDASLTATIWVAEYRREGEA